MRALPRVLAALVVLATAAALHGAGMADAAPFDDLVVLDCTGTLHVLPNHDRLGAGVSFPAAKRVIDRVARLAQDRARCRCPNIPSADFAYRFGMNFGSVLRAVTRHPLDVLGARRDASDFVCDQSPYTSFTHTIKDIGDALRLGIPETSCSYERWERNQSCTLQFKFASLANTVLQLAVDKCPNSVLPFVSLSCSGQLCSEFFRPCSSDADCKTGRCRNLFSGPLRPLDGSSAAADSITKAYDKIESALNTFNFWSDADTASGTCTKGSRIGKQVWARILPILQSSYAIAPMDPVAGPDYVGVCGLDPFRGHVSFVPGDEDVTSQVMKTLLTSLADGTFSARMARLLNSSHEQYAATAPVFAYVQSNPYFAYTTPSTYIEAIALPSYVNAYDWNAPYWGSSVYREAAKDFIYLTDPLVDRIATMMNMNAARNGTATYMRFDDSICLSFATQFYSNQLPVAMQYCRYNDQTGYGCKPLSVHSGACRNLYSCVNPLYGPTFFALGDSRTFTNAEISQMTKEWLNLVTATFSSYKGADAFSMLGMVAQGLPSCRGVERVVFRDIIREKFPDNMLLNKPSGLASFFEGCGAGRQPSAIGESLYEAGFPVGLDAYQPLNANKSSSELRPPRRLECDADVLSPWNGVLANGMAANSPQRKSGMAFPRNLTQCTSPDSRVVPMLHVSCSSTVSILPDTGLAVRAYLPRAHQIVDVIGKTARFLASCRNKNATADATTTQYFPWTAPMWSWLMTKINDAGLAALGNSSIPTPILKVMDALGYDRPTWTNFLVMPAGCTLRDWLTNKTCTLQFNGISDLIKGDATFRLVARQCNDSPDSIPEIYVDCAGADCRSLLEPYDFTPCKQDSDCGLNSKCQMFVDLDPFDGRDPLAALLWNGDASDRCANRDTFISDLMRIIKEGILNKPMGSYPKPTDGYCMSRFESLLRTSGDSLAEWKSRQWTRDPSRPIYINITGLRPYARLPNEAGSMVPCNPIVAAPLAQDVTPTPPPIPAKGPFTDLLTIDCNMDVHVLTSHPILRTKLSIPAVGRAFDFVSDAIDSRAKCHCPAAGGFFTPNPGNVLRQASWSSTLPTQPPCNATSGMFRDFSKFVKITLPDLCSADLYAAGKPCMLQLSLKPHDLTLQLALDRCPSNPQRTFLSLTCSGAMCTDFLRPCTDDSGCGGGLACRDVAQLISNRRHRLDVAARTGDLVKAVQLWVDSLGTSNGSCVRCADMAGAKVLSALTGFLGSAYTPQSNGVGLKVCGLTETPLGGGASFEEFVVAYYGNRGIEAMWDGYVPTTPGDPYTYMNSFNRFAPPKYGFNETKCRASFGYLYQLSVDLPDDYTMALCKGPHTTCLCLSAALCVRSGKGCPLDLRRAYDLWIEGRLPNQLALIGRSGRLNNLREYIAVIRQGGYAPNLPNPYIYNPYPTLSLTPATPPAIASLTAAVSGDVLMPWDGVTADGRSVLSPGRKSGTDFGWSPVSCANLTDRTPLVHLSCSATVSLLPTLRLSATAWLPNVQGFLSSVGGLLTKYFAACRPGADAKSAYTRYMPWRPELWLYLLSKTPFAAPPVMLPDPLMKIAEALGIDVSTFASYLDIPSTCTAAYYASTGQCRLQFTGLQKLHAMFANVIIRLVVRSCAGAPDSLPEIYVECVGTQCRTLLEIYNYKYCVQDSDCPNSAKCQIIDSLGGDTDPISKILWPDATGADSCASPQQFTRDILRLISFVAGSTYAPPANAKTFGFCAPDLQRLVSEAVFPTWIDGLINRTSTTTIGVVGLGPYPIPTGGADVLCSQDTPSLPTPTQPRSGGLTTPQRMCSSGDLSFIASDGRLIMCRAKSNGAPECLATTNGASWADVTASLGKTSPANSEMIQIGSQIWGLSQVGLHRYSNGAWPIVVEMTCGANSTCTMPADLVFVGADNRLFACGMVGGHSQCQSMGPSDTWFTPAVGLAPDVPRADHTVTSGSSAWGYSMLAVHRTVAATGKWAPLTLLSCSGVDCLAR